MEEIDENLLNLNSKHSRALEMQAGKFVDLTALLLPLIM